MKFHGGVAQAVVCGFALCVALASNAWAEFGTAKVQAIRAGSAQYSGDGVTFSPLQVGTVLQQGATVRTDSMGIVDLYLGKNGPLLRLTPATTLALTTLTFESGAGETIVDTELGLTTGSVLGVVRKLSASSRYEVKTPVGTCGIRGTKYQAFATGRVVVEEGVCDVNYTPAGATSPTRFQVQAANTFDPTLNNGQGGVVPTPAHISELLQDEFQEMRGGLTGEERVQIWSPTPSWLAPDRLFDEPSLQPDSIGKPWYNPPVKNPLIGFEIEEPLPPVTRWR